MKILYITEIYPDVKRGLGVWGGGEKQFYEISKWAARRGHQVNVLTCRFPGQPANELVDGVPVIRVGLTRNSKGGARRETLPVIAYILQTARQAVRLNPDLVHCNTYFPVYAGWLATQILSVPLIVTFHDVYRLNQWVEGQRSHFWGFLGYCATLAAARLPINRIIAVSPQCKQKLLAHGVHNDDVTVISNGVNLSLFDSTHVQKIPHQILYVGRLIGLKHVDKLIHAFGEVLKTVPDASLKIVGDGPERTRLQELARNLGLQMKITFTGVTPFYEDVARYFKESSIFVLPSTVEGESIATKEAMATGLPVIAIRIKGSGVLTLVQDGENGFLVEPGDQDGLVEKIIELLQDRKKRKRMGAAGRKSVEPFDWKTVAERVLDVYHDETANN